MDVFEARKGGEIWLEDDSVEGTIANDGHLNWTLCENYDNVPQALAT